MYNGTERQRLSAYQSYSIYLQEDFSKWESLVEGVCPELHRRGEVIRAAGDTSARATVLRTGVAQVGTVLHSGRGIGVYLGGPGCVYGLASNLMGPAAEPTLTCLTALSDCEVYHVPRHLCRQWIARSPEHHQAVASHEMRKAVLFMQHIELLALSKIRSRVLALLLALAGSLGEDRPDGVEIPLTLTHQQLADIVLSDRVTVARILSDLTKLDLLAKRGGHYILYDVPELCRQVI